MPTPVRPRKSNGTHINVWWIRKKVPLKLRPLVGKGEVWRSLDTVDRRTANERIGSKSAEIEAEWAAIEAAARQPAAPPKKLTQRDLHALRKISHIAARDPHLAVDPTVFDAMRVAATVPGSDDGDGLAILDETVRGFLAAEGVDASPENVERFRPLLIKARRDAASDIFRAASLGDYSDNSILETLPDRTIVKVDIMKAFESYCSRPDVIKHGLDGPTAERWRPVMLQLIEFLKHRDLSRVTQQDAVRWKNKKLGDGIKAKAVRDVWLAAPRSVCTYMVNELKLASNPFAGVKVDGVKKWKEDDERGFDENQALAILTATVSTPSHLISTEMRAARRWVPWCCAYTGARVSEITSLWPADIQTMDGHVVFVIKEGLAKSKALRRVPVHPHLDEQGFLDYVEERRKLGKPLFYEPLRARGGRKSNPQWAKVGERLCEWIRKSIKITDPGIQPNHGWRHLFRELSRGTRMKEELVNYMIGHESKSGTGARYGKRKVPDLVAAMNLFPRFKVPALEAPPSAHKRVRRTPAQIAADNAARIERRAKG